MRSPRAFLLTAETALGHPIEVVAGREEARLIYLGVAHGLPQSKEKRLVVDIGGGSTEFIIGRGLEALETESIQVGCVASQLRFFPDGKFTRRRWERAQDEIGAEFQQFASDYRAVGWRDALGSSGTAKALRAISEGLGHGEHITRESLADIRDRILAAGEVEKIRLPELSDDRRPVIGAGALILETAFDALGIARMGVSETAMREGLLYDMLGRHGAADPRETSIAGLQKRYGVDRAHAERVERTALALFRQVAVAWSLEPEHRDWLVWAARVHEIGLAIAHSSHHVHGAYVIGHADLFGFTRQEQQVLAFLVRAHRRGLPVEELNTMPERLAEPASRVLALLRLAVSLNRGRSSEPLPDIQTRAGEKLLRLTFPAIWLDQHPLTRTDLDTERKQLAALGFRLQITSA